MYTAMNRFKVKSDPAHEFEALWLNQDRSHLQRPRRIHKGTLLNQPDAERAFLNGHPHEPICNMS